MADANVLVDTDAGVDDILALFILFHLIPATDVDVAITFGNVPVDQAIRNVALFNLLAGCKPNRTYRGSEHPLRREPHYALDVHGTDGLGGVTLRQYAKLPEHLTTGQLGDIQPKAYSKIIAIGPLTDIAALVRRRLILPRLYIMGGAFGVPGNISPVAEFNFFADPEAAATVFDGNVGEIFVIPLDVCNKITLTRSHLSQMYYRNTDNITKFLYEIHQHYMDFYFQKEGIDGCHPHDAIAVFAAYNPSLVNWVRGNVRVLESGVDRGRSVFTPNDQGRHYVAVGVKSELFFDLLERVMADREK